MKVLIFGAGYVGISTGVVLSKAHDVRLIDIDKKRVDMINSGDPPIHEEGLEAVLKHAVSAGKLRALMPDENTDSQDVVLVCVGTPSREDGSVDTTYVKEAARTITRRIPEFCNEYLVLGMKSTVPPGTTRALFLDNLPKRYQTQVGVVFNPEFLREGSAIADTLHPDRIVLGTNDTRAFEQLRSMYRDVLDDDSVPFVNISIESAEMSKYVSNCFLSTKISFANEMANVAESVPRADIDEVMHAVGLDKRISPKFFGSGAGFGGSCFPKDLRGLISFSEQRRVQTPILHAVLSTNQSRPSHLIQMLQEHHRSIDGRTIAVLGIAFKPGTDDTRESPSVSVIRELAALGAKVRAHDPLADKMHLEGQLPKGVNVTTNLDECLRGADACILITEWPLYRDVGLENLTKLMRQRVFIDGRRVFARERVSPGTVYRTVGMHFDARS